MVKLRFQTMIERSPETVYDLISDIPAYHSWLPASSLYQETRVDAGNPVQVGTTYVDQGTSSAMQGKITELVPLKHVGFEQSSQFKRGMASGSLSIHVRYTLKPVEQGTHVLREFQLHTGGLMLLFQPVLLQMIRKENKRILERMKFYLEAR